MRGVEPDRYDRMFAMLARLFVATDPPPQITVEASDRVPLVVTVSRGDLRVRMIDVWGLIEMDFALPHSDVAEVGKQRVEYLGLGDVEDAVGVEIGPTLLSSEDDWYHQFVDLWTRLAEATDRGEVLLAEIAIKRATELDAQAALHGDSFASRERIAEIKREHAQGLARQRAETRDAQP